MIETTWTDTERQRILEHVAQRLWMFVRASARTYRHAEEIIAQLTLLPQKDIGRLRSIHFLLSDKARQVITDSVPSILRRLSKSSHSRLITSRGAVKGRIDWWETYRERLACGWNDRSIHRFREPFRLYDLPENQLMKHLVTEVDRLAEDVGIPSIAAEEVLDNSEISKWTKEVGTLRFLCGRYLRNIYMHQISSPTRITGRMLYSARTARNAAYGEVAEAYEFLRDLVLREDLSLLRQVINEMVLAPLWDEILYELYILFETMGALEEQQWRPKPLRLIGRQRSRAVARYEAPRADAMIDIYYQRLPPRWKDRSQYTDLFEHYDLAARLRLPDIVLQVKRGTSVAHLLVEVKLSKDHTYITDSVYKVLGYLNDFRDVFEGQTVPHAILAVWEGVKRRPGHFPEDEIIIATHADYRTYLIEAVESLVTQLPEAVAVA